MRRVLLFSLALACIAIPCISSAAGMAPFLQNLQLWDTGTDAYNLQVFLNTNGYPLVRSGNGSAGHETYTFGTHTYQAIVQYQADHNLPPTGFFGPLTRASVNAALSSGSSAGPSAPVSTQPTLPLNAPLFTTPPAVIPGQPFQAAFGGGGSSSTPAPASTPDTTVPSVSLTSPVNGVTVGGVSVSLTATASDNVAVANVQFKVDGASIGSAVTVAPYTTVWNSAGVGDGSHTLSAVAADTSGNLATSSISVTTDNTAPVISSIATTSVNNTSATVTWSTNEPATSQVNYGTSVSYGTASSSAVLTTSHRVTLTGLTASTTYDFQIQSADGAGNIATSSNKLFTTQTGLLGVNISGPEFAPWNGQTFPNNADFAYLAGKGVTFVRLPISWESLQPTLASTLNVTYLGKVETAISQAHANGIGVIVDIHNFASYCAQAHWVSNLGNCGYAGNAGNTGTGVNFLGDGTLTSPDFADLWTRLSTSLTGTPGLLGYGLMNEPTSNIVATNMIVAPNGFADSIGTQAWITLNSAVLTQLGPGTNPVNAAYGPAWSITSGTGFGGLDELNVPFLNIPYTISFYAKTLSGTVSIGTSLDFSTSINTSNITTTWTRYSTTTTTTAGTHTVGIGFNVGAGSTIDIADMQVEQGSSATTYQPNPYLPYAQAAITAIRAVDATTPIYVNGFQAGTAYTWPWVNWELASLTGGTLVFEAHQYFDGAVTQGGDGGVYSGTFSSYSIDSTAGVQEVAPFESWLASTTQNGYLGEYAIPDNSKGDQASWIPVMDNFLQSLIAHNVPSTMWYYGSPGLQPTNNLGISTSTTLNAGADDPRLVQMLLQY